MADRDRIAAGLSYLEQQKRADPLESFRSLEGLKGAYERRVQPIINNAMQTFETGGAIGDLLRAYGSAAAPANAAVLEGMGMPYRGPITAPRQEGVSSGENFRAMGDPRQQAVGQMIGDPANLAQPVGARLANALKFAKPDAIKMVQELSQGARSQMGMNIGPKKQALIDAGYYHPIGGGKKLEAPISEMLFTAQENTPKVARTIISPESMQGSTIIPAVGDRTAAGMLLTDIGGKPLNSPVQLEGGADFMRTHAPYGAAWASDKGVITALSKKVREAGEKGDVYMPHVAMSHTSGDFSNMMADALLEQMRATNISKTAKLEFDRSMRKVRPEWKGIDNPETLADMKSNGAIRTAFVAEANLDKYANRGFPSIARTRVAITDPNLMDVPMHSTGYTVAKMNPEGLVIDQPQAPHGSYSHQLGGMYAGGFEKPIPRDIMFPDFYAKRRAMGADVAGDMRSFQLGNPVQAADQQWLDGLMRYLQGQ